MSMGREDYEPNGVVIHAESKFGNKNTRRTPISNENVTPIRSVTSRESSTRIIEHLNKYASSMYDSLSAIGRDREANFLFDICVNNTESGDSDGVVSHKAFQYLENFPEISEKFKNRPDEQPRKVGKISLKNFSAFYNS